MYTLGVATQAASKSSKEERPIRSDFLRNMTLQNKTISSRVANSPDLLKTLHLLKHF